MKNQEKGGKGFSSLLTPRIGRDTCEGGQYFLLSSLATRRSWTAFLDAYKTYLLHELPPWEKDTDKWGTTVPNLFLLQPMGGDCRLWSWNTTGSWGSSCTMHANQKIWWSQYSQCVVVVGWKRSWELDYTIAFGMVVDTIRMSMSMSIGMSIHSCHSCWSITMAVMIRYRSARYHHSKKILISNITTGTWIFQHIMQHGHCPSKAHHNPSCIHMKIQVNFKRLKERGGTVELQEVQSTRVWRSLHKKGLYKGD